jgi:hypothetical protein
MDDKLDLINEKELKRIEFKVYDCDDTLWDLRELRGILDDSAVLHSVANRLSDNIDKIADNLHENDNDTNKKLLKDIVFVIEFFNGYA